VDNDKNPTILPKPTGAGGGPSHAGVTIGFCFQTCKGQEHESLAALQGPHRKIAHALLARENILKAGWCWDPARKH
jgi:hypothetical protein